MVWKPFEHSVQQLHNTRMLTSGRKSPYGVVYLDEGVWFLVLSSFQSNFANSAMWEPFERPPHNFVFASDICPTSVQLLLTRDHEKKL